MVIIFSSMVLMLIISYVLLFLALIISKKSLKDREKNSPFECGFNPFSSSRMPFSLRFFLIAIIFLIFDIEISLILPLPISMNFSDYKYIFVLGQAFLLILVFGLFHEWKEGALQWASLLYI